MKKHKKDKINDTPENMALPKILIGSPTSERKDYCFLEWIAHVRQIDYPKYKMDILMVDNTPVNGYDKYLSGYDIITRHVNPRNKNSIEFICDSHNVIRDYFLYNNYDYLLHLESDVMIDTQTLRTLLFHSQQNDLPVVSASYFHGEDSDTNMLLQRLESHGTPDGIKAGMPYKFRESMNMCGSFSKIYACGVGAVLIRRDVLEKINFRFNAGEFIHPDSFFYEDCFKLNFPVYIDTSLMLNHKSQNWNHNIDAC